MDDMHVTGAPPAQTRVGPVLPRGTLPVAVGLFVAGVAAYAFLVVAARALGPARYASLSSLWFVGFFAGTGFFLPIEQELATAIAARRAHTTGAAPVVRQAAQAGAVLLVVLLLAAGAGQSPLRHRLFADDVTLLVGLCLVLGGYYVEHLARGVLGGTGAFRLYGVLLASEGVFRLAACAVLVATGISQPGPFGIAVGLAPFLATALVLPALGRAVEPGPPARWHELSFRLTHLMAASVLSQGLANAAPVVARLLSDVEDDELVGRFVAAVVLTRVPLFFFGAVQATLLPRLAREAGAGRYDEFVAHLRRVLVLLAGVAITATGAALTVGPFVLRLVFGERFVLGATDLSTLAAASGAHMIALCLAQALIALGVPGRVVLGWISGAVVFAAVAWTASGLLFRVQTGFLAGEVVTVIVLWLLVRPLVATKRRAACLGALPLAQDPGDDGDQ